MQQVASTQLNNDVLIYTFVNGRHHIFVAPCIFSALHSNPGVHVEIAVDSIDEYMAKHGREYHMLKALYGDQFTIRTSNVFVPKKMLPHTVRFIETPVVKRKYTYITDADIFLSTSDFAKHHLAHMGRIGLPYSNMVRRDTKRLTGLHFTETEALFPVPDLSDLDLYKWNDEAVLYEAVARRGLPMPPDEFRPVHGVHFSLNRPEVIQKDGGGPGWTNRAQWEAFQKFARGPEFEALWLVLSTEFRVMIHRLRAACEAEWGVN